MSRYARKMSWVQQPLGFRRRLEVLWQTREKYDLPFVTSQWTDLPLLTPRIALFSTHFFEKWSKQKQRVIVFSPKKLIMNTMIFFFKSLIGQILFPSSAANTWSMPKVLLIKPTTQYMDMPQYAQNMKERGHKLNTFLSFLSRMGGSGDCDSCNCVSSNSLEWKPVEDWQTAGPCA